MTNPNPDKQRRAARRAARTTETSEYATFVLRVLKNLGDRIADDPAMLAHIPAIQQAIPDNINRGIRCVQLTRDCPDLCGRAGDHF
ncbi:hypothetical protein [Actinoallomurus sp. NPDC050550]|uniref:hypothetical protein n=1 Tax=Actinoallomurus sp. NPDC050550 TaxID=3154937 RepID=UPI0033D3040D